MAEDVPIFHILDLSKQVDECDVTVDVKKLIPKKDVVLSKKVQESAKKFFTPDAWMAVQQTLQILEGKFFLLFFSVLQGRSGHLSILFFLCYVSNVTITFEKDNCKQKYIDIQMF